MNDEPLAMFVERHRCGLVRARRRLEAGALTIGFVGGSITDGRVPGNWPEPVAQWFARRYPGARIAVENAAIGATGSELAVFRAERDLIAPGCDLVFIEFAVNDNGEAAEKRRRTREGLIRKLLAGSGCDLVLVYTFSQDMYEPMRRGEIPASIRDFEELGQHYGIGSVWMGLHALREVEAGQMRWEDWLPDGLHPGSRGSLCYAQSVVAFLKQELGDAPSPGEIPVGERRPAALNPRNWEFARPLPLAEARLEGPWILRRWPNLKWIDQVLETAAVGATMSFEFEGRGLSLGFDFGKTSSEFRYRLDGADWVDVRRERPAWCGLEGWYRISHLADDLPPGRHRCELEVTHGNQPDCTGTNFRLALIGIVP